MKQGLILLTLLLGFGLLFTACSGSSATPTPDPNASLPDCPATISIQGFSYSPASCKVKAGTTITIQANSFHPLLAVSNNNNPIPNTRQESNQQITFSNVGVYTYKCIAHEGVGMLGSITVTN